LHSKVVNDVTDDLLCSKNIAETLETIVKKPFVDKDLRPLSQYNFDYLEKWSSKLEAMKEELQQIWKSHQEYLNEARKLCTFEHEYAKVSRPLLELTAELNVRTDIGLSLEESTTLLKELNSFKERTKDTYEEIKAIRERGFELIDSSHYSKSSIKLRCDEIRKQCDDFQDALETRESTLQTNVDVFKCLDQLDLWGKKGLDMLASQSLDEIQSSDGASKALEQIERFISSGDGLSIGKTNKLNRLAKKLDNQELNERVKNALERTREISEMLEKRENSLQKLSKPPARPVQPVKAIQNPALSPNKREKSNNPMALNQRTKKHSTELKKDIDVVVTSQPLRKRMSFRKSRRALLSLQDPSEYKEEDAELLKKSRLVMQELIDTERDYVNDIQCVIEGYYNAFDDPEFNIPFNLRGKKNIIFGNIEGIYRFHKTVFLKELENCLETPYRAGKVFLDKQDEFQLYAIYCKNKPNSEAHTEELEQKSTFLRDFQAKLGHKLPLCSYLLKPVQRIMKYQLLLQEMMKYTNKKNPALIEIQDAIKAVKKIVRNVNDVMHSSDLIGCPEDISTLGKLLLQDTFVVWNVQKNMLKNITNLRGKHRQIFLYERAVVFARREPREMDDGKEGVVYQYKSSIEMYNVGLTEFVKDNPCKFEVWVQKRNEVYLLQAKSKEIKESWVAEIRRLLVEQLNTAKEQKHGNQSGIRSTSSLAYVDPQRRGSAPNIAALPFSAPPDASDMLKNRFSFNELLVPHNTRSHLSSILLNDRRGSDMDLWRSSKSSTGVYLSPANSPDFPELDTSECWSDSEFEDDLDDDEAFEVNQEQDSVSQCSSHASSSEVSTKRTFSAIANHSSEEANELSLCEGDSLELVQTGDEGWWFMKNIVTKKEGWTPSSYLVEQNLKAGVHIEGQNQNAKVPSPRPRIETTV